MLDLDIEIGLENCIGPSGKGVVLLHGTFGNFTPMGLPLLPIIRIFLWTNAFESMEASSPCYTESQAFRQPWLWAILWVLLVGWAIMVTVQLGWGIPVGDNPMPDVGLLLIGAVPIGLVWLFWCMRLLLRIESTGISVRFVPMMGWRHFDWEDIEELKLRRYHALSEYGGWGVRTNYKSRALTTAGDLGLEITLQSGGQWLIGTQDGEGLQQGIVSCAPDHLWMRE